MALDATAIRDFTRDILYGTGLGEKPTLVQGTGTAVVSGSTAVFSVSDGTKLRAGDILSVLGAADAAASYSFYVLSISTNELTCVNGYEGAAIANSGSTALIFEVMPLVGGEKIFKSIDTVIGHHLWPYVFDIETGTVTPDIVSGQVNLNARDEEILDAWQKVATQMIPISFHLEKKMPTTEFASGNMGSFDFIDTSTAYYSAKRRITLADSTGTAGLNDIIAAGAAAVCLGGTQVETTLDSSKKDAQDRGQRDIAAMLWRDFLTQRQAFAEDLSRDTVLHFVIERS